MDMIQQLNEARKLAGLPAITPAKADEMAKKNKDKKEIFATGKLAKDDPARADDSKKTKKDASVDDGKAGPSKGAMKSMDSAAIKPHTKKKKKVSEEINEALLSAGVTSLTAEQALVFDRSDFSFVMEATGDVTVEIDWADDNDETEKEVMTGVQQGMKKFKIEGSAKVVTMKGPGGGWPVVRVTGQRAQLEKWLEDIGYEDGIETYLVK